MRPLFSNTVSVKAALGIGGLLLALSLSSCSRSSAEPVTTVPTPALTDIPAVTLSPTATPTTPPTSTPTADPTNTPTPSPIPQVAPAPAALNTDPDTYTYLVNRDYPLSADYAPEDLVVPNILFSFSNTNVDKAKLRKEAADALTELFDAAFEEEGYTLYGVSAYRSYSRQYTIYATNLILQGVRHTNLYSAAPGMSEHQTGLTIDVSCAAAGMALEDYFADTPEGQWLEKNAYRFGYIIRYPKGKEHLTGYSYEPWHIRYVGIPLAYYLYQNDLTLDEYYGYTPTYQLEELADTPLIDTTSADYLALYEQYFPPAPEPEELPILDFLGNPILDPDGKPYLKEVILNADGEPLLGEGDVFYYKEAIFSADGTLLLSPEGTPYFKEPVFSEDGLLLLQEDGSPCFLEPVFAEDGSLLLDETAKPVFAPATPPEETPAETPEEASEETPTETPEEASEETPTETPEEASEEAVSENPETSEKDSAE